MTAPFAKLKVVQSIPETEIRQQFEQELLSQRLVAEQDLKRREDGSYFYGYLQTMFIWYRKGYEAGACRN
jgi:hypothetical protein